MLPVREAAQASVPVAPQPGRHLAPVGLREEPHPQRGGLGLEHPDRGERVGQLVGPDRRDRDVEDAPQGRPGSVHSREDALVLDGVELLD